MKSQIQHKSEVISEFATNSFRIAWPGCLGALALFYIGNFGPLFHFFLFFEYASLFLVGIALEVSAYRFQGRLKAGKQNIWFAMNFSLRLLFVASLSLILCFQFNHYGFFTWGGLIGVCMLGIGVESIITNTSSWPTGAWILIGAYTVLPLATTFYLSAEGSRVFGSVAVVYLLLQIPKIKNRYRIFVQNSEIKLRLDRERLFTQEILDSVPDPIFTKDEKHKWIFANRAFCQMLGKPLHEVVGKSDYDFFPREMADIFWEKDNQVLLSQVSNENEEIVRDYRGHELTTLTKKTPVQLSNGITALVGIVRDITHRKKLEKANQMLVRRLEILAKASHMAVWYYNDIENGFEATADYYKILGIAANADADSVQSQFYKNVDSAFLPAYLEKVERFRSGEIDSFFLDAPYNPPAGGSLWVRIFMTIEERSSTTKKPISVIGYVQDISQVKKMEERLEAQSRLTALGEMASGIAHEINNPLMIISGRMHMLMKELQTDSGTPESAFKKVEYVEKVLETVDRITKIIRGLKFFSRSEEKEPFKSTDLETVIMETLAICEEHFKSSGIELSVESLPLSKTPVDCRSTQISQVLINLLNNSFDALSSQTALNLRAEEKKWIRLNCENADSKIRISVTDSGHGIPHAIANKLMQPFFTTKEVGKGTGLGLSISKGIIEDHGGRIWLDQDNKNTRFIFEIPIRQRESSRIRISDQI
jgi:PAS domain S-box-containing protein